MNEHKYASLILKLLLVALCIAILIGLSACGPKGPEDINTDNQPAVGETLIADGLNAISNANGDGQADTTPKCNNIVC